MNRLLVSIQRLFSHSHKTLYILKIFGRISSEYDFLLPFYSFSGFFSEAKNDHVVIRYHFGVYSYLERCRIDTYLRIIYILL